MQHELRTTYRHTHTTSHVVALPEPSRDHATRQMPRAAMVENAVALLLGVVGDPTVQMPFPAALKLVGPVLVTVANLKSRPTPPRDDAASPWGGQTLRLRPPPHAAGAPRGAGGSPFSLER